MKHNNHGFSLIETVVAMAILGAFTVSICTCLVLSLRMNEKTSTLMQEQMAVSSAVETLMATGIPENESNRTALETKIETDYSVAVDISNDGSSPYYNVTITSKDVDDSLGNVTVNTQIREAVTGE